MASTRVPKLIHALWIPPSANAELPSQAKTNIQSWSDTHFDFFIKVWSYEDARRVCCDLDFVDVEAMLDAVTLLSVKSDIIRHCLLYIYGGVWTDLKNYFEKRFLCRYQDQPLGLFEHWPTSTRPEPKGYLASSLIVSEEGNDFTKAFLKRIEAKIKARVIEHPSSLCAGDGMTLLLREFPEYARYVVPVSAYYKACMKRTMFYFTDEDVAAHWSKTWRNSLYIK